MHLFFSPLLSGVILVQASQVAVIALVEGLVMNGFQISLADGIENVLTGFFGPLQNTGEGDVKSHAALCKSLPRSLRLGVPFFGQVGIAPSREEVLEVPFALTVTDKDKGSFHYAFPDCVISKPQHIAH